MNIMIMWMKEWVELYTFCKTRASTLTVKRIFSEIQNPLQIFSSVAITKCDFVATQRMTDTVTVSIRFNPCVKSIHERITKRHSKQKTKVVVAMHVLEIVWHMLATM